MHKHTKQENTSQQGEALQTNQSTAKVGKEGAYQSPTGKLPTIQAKQRPVPAKQRPVQRKESEVIQRQEVVQRVISSDDTDRVAEKLASMGIKADKIKDKDIEKAIKEIRPKITGIKKTDYPAITDAFKTLKQAESAKEKVETSDIKATYTQSKGCALQALIESGQQPFGQTSAKDLHDHIWGTPDLAQYKEYDTDKVWKQLYADLGLSQVAVPAGTKVKELDSHLSEGTYLCETHGHMIGARVSSKGGVEILQDSGNAIGKEGDVVLTCFQ